MLLLAFMLMLVFQLQLAAVAGVSLMQALCNAWHL
jgi:hypothetical protein